MKRWLTFLLALLIFALVHEGTHALVALAYGEYDAFHVRPIGFEVTVKTPTMAETLTVSWWAWGSTGT